MSSTWGAATGMGSSDICLEVGSIVTSRLDGKLEIPLSGISLSKKTGCG